MINPIKHMWLLRKGKPKVEEVLDEQVVSLDDLERFENSDTWKALCDALDQRRCEALLTTCSLQADESGIRFAQGKIHELNFVLEVFLPLLKEEIEEQIKETKNG